MNLHSIVGAAISAVNPRVQVSVQTSTGVVPGSSANAYKPTPTYAAPVTMVAQTQPLSTRDLRQVEALNLQGTLIAMYLYGEIRAIVRATAQGGDVITVPSGPYAGVWLVTMVVEGWDSAGWCKVICVLQDNS